MNSRAAGASAAEGTGRQAVAEGRTGEAATHRTDSWMKAPGSAGQGKAHSVLISVLCTQHARWASQYLVISHCCSHSPPKACRTSSSASSRLTCPAGRDGPREVVHRDPQTKQLAECQGVAPAGRKLACRDGGAGAHNRNMVCCLHAARMLHHALHPGCTAGRLQANQLAKAAWLLMRGQTGPPLCQAPFLPQPLLPTAT